MKKEVFAELLESVKQGAEILKGTLQPTRTFRHRRPKPVEKRTPNVKRIRRRYGLSQQNFGRLIGVSAATVQKWEQGTRLPQGAARVLLHIADTHPEIVLKASATGAQVK